MPQKLTTEEFIKRAKEIHGGKCDYSKVEYVNNSTKVCLICNTCKKEFWQNPNSHLQGRKCPYCAINKRKKTTEQFIEEAKAVHGTRYDYSKTEYINSDTSVTIICPIHKEFSQLPYHHLKGCGCPKCSGNIKKTTEEFIEQARTVHGNKYDYSKVEYVNEDTPIIIICPIHGDFKQTPRHHLKGCGCQTCNVSKGEEATRKYLFKNYINFTEQMKFEECKNKKPLPFDFYLPDYNICIEYQGKQHYESSDFFGGELVYRAQQINDSIKKEYCQTNGVKLICVPYWENVEEYLDKELLPLIGK